MSWAIPDGYELVPAPRAAGVTLVVARRAREPLLDLGIDRPEEAASGPAVASWVGGGRVRHPVIRVGDELWILKAYRRGGIFAPLNRDRYFSVGRFLRELATASTAARAGVPAPEPIALVIRSGGRGGGFRVWQVVEYVPRVASLREILSRDPVGERGEGAEPRPAVRAMFRAAGSAVRKMHEADIDHPDLNIGNILARLEDAEGSKGGGLPCAEAFIVDWDRARLRSPGSWNPHRNLFRLWRSVLKLSRFAGPAGSPDPAAVRAFLRGYFGQNREGLRALRGYVRPRRFLITFHTAFWGLARSGRPA